MSIDIRNVKDMNNLIKYFAHNLNWNIAIDSFEDIDEIAYDFDASDLGLKEEAFARIRSLKQLPPLVDNQPWGIFCVEFDSKKFEVTALRKVLSGLIPKRRNSVNHAVWDKENLLFICFWGEDNNRTIGIARFEDKGIGLPQIKIIYCAPAIEDTIQIHDFTLRIANLSWPIEVINNEKWIDDWSKAFTTGYKQTIRDSETLTRQLANEAVGIRDRILEILNVETEDGYVHQLYKKFKETLIHDMKENEFADMYAQTVVYGLFSARCMDNTQDDFSAGEAVDCIPNTNPFLKRLMQECLGAQQDSKLSFDELEIGNVVELLTHTKTNDIIRDFNRQTGRGKEDTVIHFYEEFLEAYDKTQKVQRGVYYTPQPVVSFIVRAVDQIIKGKFGLVDGLASTNTKKIKVSRLSKRLMDGYYRQVEDYAEVPAIQILDPATGTGTFLRQTILQIYENFKLHNSHMNDQELKKSWNDYVPKHLLPRLNAFELMMAPYAVAHMKLALVLKDTGYDFQSNERLNVYLTNSLEEAGNSDKQIAMWDDPLASESVAANAVKKNTGINVVIGNPPYNVSSSNKSEWINAMIQPYKEGLTERKLNLDDDYIKFLRYAQIIAGSAENGIVGYITNNSFIDGITHRQIRKSLMSTFSEIYILDLHGNVMKHEKCADGGKDENVFDITQGVSICIMVKNSKCQTSSVYHYELLGSRDSKYDFLLNKNMSDIEWTELNPDNDKALFIPFNSDNQEKYNSGIHVDSLFNLYNSGIQTKCDPISVGMCEQDVRESVSLFINKSVEELKQLYPDKKDSSGWSFGKAKEEIERGEYCYTPYYYRPFDVRYTVYTGKSGGFIGRSREVVMQHVVNHRDNICLCMMKQFFQDTLYNHILVSNLPIDERTLYSNRGGTYLFPLYIYYEEFGKTVKRYNLNAKQVERIEASLGISLSYESRPDAFTGEDLFAYIYAVLYSNKYRTEYNDYLKYAFPVVPMPENVEYFFGMVELGRQLISVHLPDGFYRASTGNTIISELKKYEYDAETNSILINSSYRISAEQDIYNYEIGGYKPIQKWLKDRKGLPLMDSDVDCLKRIVLSIETTKSIVDKIDCMIDI